MFKILVNLKSCFDLLTTEGARNEKGKYIYIFFFPKCIDGDEHVYGWLVGVNNICTHAFVLLFSQNILCM